MYRILLFLVCFGFCQKICTQVLENDISQDLFKAVNALNDNKYIESINYLEKCQDQLGDQIRPRIEELYIINLIDLKNPILLEKHIKRYLSASNSQRSGYKEMLELSLKNKKDLRSIRNEFKIAADSYFEKDENNSSLLLLSKNNNNYYINNLGECSFSVIAKNACSFNSGYACIDDKIYTKKGKVVFRDKYDEFEKQKVGVFSNSESNSMDKYYSGFSDGLLRIKKSGKHGLLDSIGNYVIPPMYEERLALWEFSIIAKQDDKYGVLDWDGKVKIPFMYDEINANLEGEDQYRVKLNDSLGLVNGDNEVLVPIEYDDISFLNKDNLARVKRSGKYGFINNLGQTVVPIIYDNSLDNNYYNDSFYLNRAILKLNNKYGIISNKNKELVGFVYDSIIPKSNNCLGVLKFAAKKEHKWGLIDSLGKELIPFKYDEFIKVTYNDGVILKKNGKTGVLDLQGDIIIPLEYDEIDYRFINRRDCLYMAVKGDVNYFYFEGKLIFKGIFGKDFLIRLPSLEEDTFEKVGSCNFNYSGKGIFVQSSSKKIITHEGKSVFPSKYVVEDINYNIMWRYSYQFFDNIDLIKPKMNLVTLKNKNGKLAFADVLTGEIVTKFEYENSKIYRINSAYRIYKKSNKYGVLDYNLEEVIPFEYDFLSYVKGNKELIVSRKASKHGVLNIYGEEVMPHIYEKIEFVNTNLVKLKLNGKWIQKEISLIKK